MRRSLKRILSVILALVLVVSVIPMNVFAVVEKDNTIKTTDETVLSDESQKLDTASTEDETIEESFKTVTDIEDFEYKETADGNIEITAYKGNDYIVAIPDTINDKAVTVIGANAFKDNKNVIEILMPEGITTIGESAFNGCSELYSVLIAATVTSIADNAFTGAETTKILCYFDTAAYTFAQAKAMKYIRIYKNTVIEDDGESGTQAKWHLNLVTGLFVLYGTAMPDYSSSNAMPWYKHIEKIKALKIIDGITNIGNYSFYNCSNIGNRLIIPDSVTTIGSDAFNNCSGITGRDLGRNNEYRFFSILQLYRNKRRFDNTGQCNGDRIFCVFRMQRI